MYHDEWLAADCEIPLGIAYHFTYEEAFDPGIRLRAISYAAQVDRTRLEDQSGWSHLSTRGKLQDYERELFKEELRKGLRVPGERTRMRQAATWLNRAWCCFDMTGSDPKHPNRGKGLATEIAQIIRRDLDKKKAHNIFCGLVTVDYAGAAVERFFGATGLAYQDYRHYLGGFPLQLKREVANVFDCPVWVSHQLNAASNNRTATKISHHTDAAEARNFAENLDFCFQIGTKTRDNLCAFGATKHRRTAPSDPVVIKIVGQYGRIDWATEYMLDSNYHRIVLKSDYNRINTDALDEVERFSSRRRPPLVIPADDLDLS